MLDHMHVPAAIPCPCPASTAPDVQEGTRHPSFADPAPLPVPLRVGKYHFAVSPTFKQGYLAARSAYEQMEAQDEWGAYLFLTGYEYAHLTRQYLPAHLSPLDKREWQRGFIAGWTACSYGF